MTFILILLSITPAVSLRSNGEVGLTGVIVGIVAPLLIAPLFGGLTLRLANQLINTQDQLRLLAITDELTQAYNRRYFFEVAEQELARAKRTGEVFSVAILDMDDFKHINDTYGHRAGDSVLRL
ncbi:MAG: diguanylate cyclase [Chloroflexi bacterium]|nr:diguanylate cyclase [Chloroflexota bacterium]